MQCQMPNMTLALELTSKGRENGKKIIASKYGVSSSAEMSIQTYGDSNTVKKAWMKQVLSRRYAATRNILLIATKDHSP